MYMLSARIKWFLFEFVAYYMVFIQIQNFAIQNRRYSKNTVLVLIVVTWRIQIFVVPTNLIKTVSLMSNSKEFRLSFLISIMSAEEFGYWNQEIAHIDIMK